MKLQFNTKVSGLGQQGSPEIEFSRVDWMVRIQANEHGVHIDDPVIEGIEIYTINGKMDLREYTVRCTSFVSYQQGVFPKKVIVYGEDKVIRIQF